MSDTLSKRLGLEPPADLAHWIMPPKASQARQRIAEEEIATDRRVTVDAVVTWLKSQDLDGRDVPALLRRELLAAPAPQEGEP